MRKKNTKTTGEMDAGKKKTKKQLETQVSRAEKMLNERVEDRAPLDLSNVFRNIDSPSSELVSESDPANILAETEKMLLEGETSIYTMSRVLEIHPREVTKLIEKVEKQWFMLGDKSNLKTLKGSGIARLNKISRGLWGTLKKGKVSDDVKIYNALMTNHDRQLQIEGLVGKNIPVDIEGPGVNVGNSVKERIDKHTEMLKLADKLHRFSKYNGHHYGNEEDITDAYIIEDPVDKGGDSNAAKLHAEDIPVIRTRLSNKDKIKDIAKDYGVSTITISRIKSGKSWKNA